MQPSQMDMTERSKIRPKLSMSFSYSWPTNYAKPTW